MATKRTVKVPPHNLDAEQAILGGMLIDPEAVNKVVDILRADDFYSDAHKKIFIAVEEMHGLSLPVDTIALTDWFIKKGQLDAVGGASYLSQLLDNIATSANIAHYCTIVREKSVLRHLIGVAGDLYNSSFEPVQDIGIFIDDAEKKFFDVTQRQQGRHTFASMMEMMQHTFDVVKKLYNRKELITGVATGFGRLDELTAGLQPSDLVIIAGRPSMGKTAFALSLLKNAAVDAGTPAAFFSLEMSKEQLCMRLLASQARIELANVRKGFLQNRDFVPLTHAASELSKSEIYIDDTPGLSLLELRSRARRLKAEKKVGIIFIDYLQLMRSHTAKDSREQEISEISRGLKALAKELDIPVVALSQLSRAAEKNEDSKPQLSNLRESGAIEQDADVIMFLYREEYYLRMKGKDVPEDRKGVAEVIVAKQRNGPTDTVQVFFHDKFASFENLATTFYRE